MSKKPKSSRHRVPFREMASDEVSPEYQAEVDRSMDNLQRRYAKALRALEQAERKRSRIQEREARATANRDRAQSIAANRQAEEALLLQRIEQIKAAARTARVDAARSKLEQQRLAVLASRAEAARQRKLQIRLVNEEKQRLILARRQLSEASSEVTERRRELGEIEKLMMPGNYAGRSHRGVNQARHITGKESA